VLTALLLAAGLALTGCGAGSSSDSGSTAEQDAAVPDRGQKGAASDMGSGAGAGAGAPAKSAGTDSKEGQKDPESAGSRESTGATGSPGSGTPALDTRDIIRTADMTVRVKDLDRALRAARNAATNAGGYVSDEQTTRRETDPGEEGTGEDYDDGTVPEEYDETTIVLRVPTDRYEEVVEDLEGTGRLVERDAKAQDVTDQVVDVESRVRSQRASVDRVRKLMDRATSLADVVSLESELSRREADLESLLAQQASLKDSTSLATITLTLTEPPTPVAKTDKDDDPGIGDALSGGWDAFVMVLRWIVVVLAAVLPFAAVVALALLAWAKLLRPRRRTRVRNAPPASATVPSRGTAGLPHHGGERGAGEDPAGGDADHDA
jgi:Domain of unknown function (DUF4349)